MAFFSKLFEKKICDVCGGEIGLLGNRKLEDGNLCKNCAGRLSPWFEERRHSTVEQIKQQLAYRERNQADLQGFNPSRVIGGREYKVYVEDRDGVPFRFVASDKEDYKAANADIIYFSSVGGADVDVTSSRRELKRKNEQGEMVSYQPPRFEHNFDFYVHMNIVGCPFFDEIRFRMNPITVRVVEESYGGSILFGSSFDPSYNTEYRRYSMMCEQVVELVQLSRSRPVQPVSAAPVQPAAVQPVPAAPVQPAAAQPVPAAPMQPAEAQPVPAAPVQPAEAPRAKFCPECGAPADGGKFCQYCGTRL